MNEQEQKIFEIFFTYGFTPFQITNELVQSLIAIFELEKKEATRLDSIQFSLWKDNNCRDCGVDEWTIGPTGRVYTIEELYNEFLNQKP